MYRQPRTRRVERPLFRSSLPRAGTMSSTPWYVGGPPGGAWAPAWSGSASRTRRTIRIRIVLPITRYLDSPPPPCSHRGAIVHLVALALAVILVPLSTFARTPHVVRL